MLANAIIHTNATVGMGCIVNTAAIIEHDCVLEDFVNISPGAARAGHTRVGQESFLSIGSTIIDGITIGKESVIGAGAVALRDIPGGAVAVGAPAKVIKKLEKM